MGCAGTLIEPEGNTSVPLGGLSQFRIVPASVDFDCHSTQLDNLYYVAADTTGDQSTLSIGYVLAAEGAQANTTGRPKANEGIMGLELVAGPPCTGTCRVRCLAHVCDEVANLTRLPEELTLTVLSPKLALMSHRAQQVGGQPIPSTLDLAAMGKCGYGYGPAYHPYWHPHWHPYWR